MKKLAGIIESPIAPSTNMLWLYNGSIKYFIDGNWKEIGKSTERKIDNKNILECINLMQGNSANTRAYNIKNLKEGILFISLDNGYGVGQWTPDKGGYAYIITPIGNIYYKISKNGSVVKHMESFDLYYEYKKRGGTRTPEEFVDELVALIG